MISRAVPAAALLLAALAACGNDQQPAAGPAATATVHTTAAPSATPSATPSPTPATLTRAQAAALYTRLVAPANQAGETLNRWVTRTPDTIDLAAARAAAKADADVERTFSLKLQEAHWPQDVQAPLAQLVTDLAKLSVIERIMSTASTADQFFTEWSSATDVNNDAAGAADLIRQKLGLPAAPQHG